jgi:hypothetical protein
VKLVRFDMWRGPHKIALSEVLEAIPENTMDWRLLFLHAVGAEWLGRASIGDLEEDVREAPMGIAMTWSGLKSFAAKLTDLHDCLLAAAPPNRTLRAPEVRAEDYSSAYVVVEGFDDTTWTIGSADERILDALPSGFGVAS